MLMIRRAAPLAGFTLVELSVTLVVMAVLIALAMPTLLAWIANTRVRTVSDTLQNGLRQAQAEAVRRSRTAVFSLTNDTAPKTSLTAVANGSNWSINFVASSTLDTSGVATFVEAGVLTIAGTGVSISGPAAVCFSPLGRLVANSSTGVTGATCSLSSTPTYNITMSSADRPLRVVVSLGGQVHMCDPAKTLSSSAPDGCPS
ncbi:GspH/FimT family pseudopilin [Variovorax sp. NFACC27]|uniref:pilus assembly FimT family protein n=1 Tax=unclassified Variovorax TaxID=663243 RepID=UPI00089B0071|nr:type IV fimbrial biogenesis protein FimT [Variovorax sp. NFACC28]SEG98474.1 type IV fimbrial biogenesis protein FimT [Variovorax sp. NFACC29]SFE11007.1 type IV fimbrial biogenesis protein FimT [Variovorax sp. NFACC26]SFH16350.1 type IV fimbrial biogenesis protein FimT [Variovorax sp. NFACC27]